MAEQSTHGDEVPGEVVAVGEVGATVSGGEGEEGLEEARHGLGGHAQQGFQADPPQAVDGEGAGGPDPTLRGGHAAGAQRLGDDGREPQRVGHANPVAGCMSVRGAEAEHTGCGVAGPVDGEADALDPGVR